MKHTLYIYIATFLTLFISSSLAVAQNEEADTMINFKIHVTFKQAGEKEATTRPIMFAKFRNEKKASTAQAILQKALDQQGDFTNKDWADKYQNAWDDAIAKWNIKFRLASSGTITFHAYANEVILITTFIPDDAKYGLESDGRFQTITIQAGKRDYTCQFEKKMVSMSDNANSSTTLDGVEKIQVRDDSMKFVPPIVDDDGENLTLVINQRIPGAYAKGDTRLVLQPLAVDCQTEDTVDYIPGIVMEGEKYHNIQNRLMMFDYMKNDKVSYAYRSNKPIYPDEDIIIQDTVTYRKPDPKRSYKAPFKIQLADMTHVYLDKNSEAGSCNAIRRFKFLDLGVGAAQMDLEEFHVEADDKAINKKQDLHVTFVVGKSEFVNDQHNDSLLNVLKSELRHHGDLLRKVSVACTSSPEGGFTKNLELARQRTETARRIIKNMVPGANVVSDVARVCTWEEVAQFIERDGNPDIAKSIRENMSKDGYGGDAIMKLPNYKSYIEPILDSLRIMRVRYSYDTERKLNAQEACQEYYKRKYALIHGHSEDDYFTDGDFYNLFQSIRDSLEQDTLTTIAYRHTVSQDGYENIKFSMYVANRMAMLNLKKGKPNTDVLSPFINTSSSLVAKGRSTGVQKNRREILINQIVTLFTSEQRDSALKCLHFWFENDKDPKVIKLKNFITFKENFSKNARGLLDAQGQKEFIDAVDFVYKAAKDNRAIMYAESVGFPIAYNDQTRTLSQVTPEEADSLVSMMDDANPKKWYLKAILSAQKDTKILDSKPKGYIPDYMAYFYKSFQINPSYKYLYFGEGQISDDLHKKFVYRKKYNAKYAERFNNLYQGKAKGVSSMTSDNSKDGEYTDLPDDALETQDSTEGTTPSDAAPAVTVPTEKEVTDGK